MSLNAYKDPSQWDLLDFLDLMNLPDFDIVALSLSPDGIQVAARHLQELLDRQPDFGAETFVVPSNFEIGEDEDPCFHGLPIFEQLAALQVSLSNL